MSYPFRILDNLQVEILIKDKWRKFGQAAHYQLYEHLGIKGERLPDEGFPEVMVGNVRLWCLPKTEKPQDAARIWCECPDCGKHLTFGKLQQHRKVHKP